MKKILSCLTAVFLLMLALSACTKQNAVTMNEKISIVATTFPQYDWVRQILGNEVENIELTLLLSNGVDLHSYQPTVEDIAAISNCDMFIYVGGESDSWVESALQATSGKDRVVMNLLEILGDLVKEEEIIEGMEHSHEHEDTFLETGDEHTDDHELDEHVWLSLKNAKIICSYLSDELGKLDSKNSSVYAGNTEKYTAQLTALDTEYQNTVKTSPVHTLLFGDRFPFRYLTDDYNLNYYAAFSGCSAETEASFETIVFLTDKADKLNLQNIMVIESSDQSIAATIVQSSINKNQTILVLDSMQSITTSALASGTTYLSIMEKNLEVLKEALS